MKRAIGKFFRILKYALTERKYFLLYIIREEALEQLDTFNRIGVGMTEDIQDLIYHIDSYINLPEMLQNTTYKGYLEEGLKFQEYFEELEQMRALERDYIFELMKTLPIGFKL